MNKVITINLGGNAYQLEEAGYAALGAYLESATARLQGNPDKDEIVADIERAIADKFRALLGSHKSVVETREVAAIIAEMGPVEADRAETTGPGASGADGPGIAGGTGAQGQERPTSQDSTPRRLYRIREGAQVFGVCNGIAAYFNLDPTMVRIAFLLLFALMGVGLPLYLVLMFVIPEAATPEQKTAAYGPPPTAQDFIRRAREGYYETMKDFPDRKVRKEWRRRFRRQMRWNAEQWRQNWQSGWGPQGPGHPGVVVALPFLSLLHGVVTILWVCASISLLATGSLLGKPLPASVPLWGAALLLLVAYGILVAPLKAARRACYWGGAQRHPGWSLVFLVDAALWVAIFAVLLWLATHYFPELREAVRTLPTLVQQAASDIRAWWKSK